MFKTIWGKIKLISIILIPILIVSGSIILKQSKKIKDENLAMLEKMDQGIKLSKDLNANIIQIQQWLTDISATRAAKGFDDGFDEAEKFYNQSKDEIEKLKGLALIENTKLDSLKEDIRSFYTTGKEMALLYIKDGPEGGNAYMSTFDEASEKLQKSLQPILEKIDEEQENAFRNIKNNLEFNNNVILITFFILVFFIIGSLIAFGKSLVEAIQSKINTISSNIQELLKNAQNLDSNSDQLNSIVERQLSNLQTTVSAVDEINSMVQRNADSATHSTKVSNKSNEVASKGKRTVESMIQSIHDISSSNDNIMREIQTSNQNISNIINVISEIGEKTKVINDIVFQTKLLSFNASVEAARAGDHGKGFSVVAEEVGNLAAMSGKAALEITEMLDASIKQVTDIVNRTKDKVDQLITISREKVEIGISTANECGNSLEEILKNVDSVNKIVKEISSASSEQADGIHEVTQSIRELDEAARQNTSISKESSLMARTLNAQADQLEKAVEQLTALIMNETNQKIFNKRNRNDSNNIIAIEKKHHEKMLKVS